MEFSFTDEQEAFRTVLRRFLEAKSPTTEVRRLMETEAGFDRAVWKQLSDDLGLPGIHIPEAYGGQGFGFVAEMPFADAHGGVVFGFEEIGDGDFIGMKSHVGAGPKDAGHAQPGLIRTGHQRRSRSGADTIR